MAKQFDIDNIFTYHPPFGDQAERYVQIREAARYFATLIENLAPPSRERSVAFTELQSVVMWANASIANNEVNPIVFVELPIVGDPALGMERPVVEGEVLSVR